jgi:hypothetical protein
MYVVVNPAGPVEQGVIRVVDKNSSSTFDWESDKELAEGDVAKRGGHVEARLGIAGQGELRAVEDTGAMSGQTSSLHFR